MRTSGNIGTYIVGMTPEEIAEYEEPEPDLLNPPDDVDWEISRRLGK